MSWRLFHIIISIERDLPQFFLLAVWEATKRREKDLFDHLPHFSYFQSFIIIAFAHAFLRYISKRDLLAGSKSIYIINFEKDLPDCLP